MPKKLLTFLLISFCTVPGAYAQTRSTSVFFETDQSGLTSMEQAKLDAFTKSLDTVLISAITIKAYCDDRGSDAYNKVLSLKRADHIRQKLSATGIRAGIQTEAIGEVALYPASDTSVQRAHNRRADISAAYSTKEKPIATEKPVADIPKPVEKPLEILSDHQQVGDKVTLNNILFAGGSHFLLPESYETLKALTALLLEKKKYHIMILGHICCIKSGSDGMDFDTGIQNLSVARARAVYNYLVEQGVSPKRLSYKGMKANYPTGKSDREDRRVEIEITKIDETVSDQ